jgi:hypothetical protein
MGPTDHPWLLFPKQEQSLWVTPDKVKVKIVKVKKSFHFLPLYYLKTYLERIVKEKL